MKNKIVFATVLIASCFILFSFRGTSETNKEAEIFKVKHFSKSLKNFSESAQSFPDKFTRWRKDWNEYSNLKEMDASLDEMNKALEKF